MLMMSRVCHSIYFCILEEEKYIMSNLGLYQTMTTWAKKAGGPVQFLGLVAAGGYLVLRTVEAGGKVIIKIVTKKIASKEENDAIYTVHTAGVSNEGLQFAVGDTFRVLEIDKDAVLIEKIGDDSSPYFVTSTLLYSISDFDYLHKGR